MVVHIYVRSQGRVMDRGTVFSVAIAGFPVWTRPLATDFFNASLGFRQIVHTSLAEILHTNIR